MIHVGDALTILRTMPDESVHMICTSPPYWGLRSYIADGDPLKPLEMGLERTPEEYIARMVEVFREARRVLRSDGTAWVNMGDSYAGGGNNSGNTQEISQKQGSNRGNRYEKKSVPDGLKPKDLCGIPWRLALALQADGWYLRADIIWHKPNPMPESVTDRPTKAHEYIFLLSKSARYFYDAEAIKEDASTIRPDLLEFGPRPDVGYTGRMQNRKRKKVPAGWDPIDHGRQGNGRFTTAGKNNGTDAQTAGRRMVESVATARANGAPHDSPFGGRRNARSVWTIATQPFPEAHFATFPEALAERCIRAGTSERGCCPECGAPWVRVVEVGALVPDAPGYKPRGVNRTADGIGSGATAPEGDGRPTPNHHREKTTLGWRPSCDHGLDPIPCTVLDPFSGAGTTLLVAAKLNRRGVGIELKPEYAQMAERRIAEAMPLFAGEARS